MDVYLFTDDLYFFFFLLAFLPYFKKSICRTNYSSILYVAQISPDLTLFVLFLSYEVLIFQAINTVSLFPCGF